MPEIVGRLRTPRLATAPGSPQAGEMYYDTPTNTLLWWNGSAWVSGGGTSTTEVVVQAGTPGAGPTLWIDTDDPDPNPYAVEALHLVGGAGEPGFAAGWSNYGGGFQSAGFYKDSQGRVFLQGLVKKSSAIVGGEAIFTLPTGYRPVANSLHPAHTGAGLGRIDVYPNGAVAVSSGSNVYMGLDGISFRIA